MTWKQIAERIAAMALETQGQPAQVCLPLACPATQAVPVLDLVAVPDWNAFVMTTGKDPISYPKPDAMTPSSGSLEDRVTQLERTVGQILGQPWAPK